MHLFEDFVDVRRISLLSGLGALLLVACGSGGGLLSGLLLLCGGFTSGGLSGGGGLFLGFWRHFCVFGLGLKVCCEACVKE